MKCIIKHYMKSMLSVLFIICSGSLTFAQSSADSIVCYIRNIEEANGLPPLSPDDPNYKEPEVELTMVVYLAELSKVKSLEIDMGNQKDGDNVRKWKYNLLNNGKERYQVQRGEKSYKVEGNKIIITERAPESIYTQKMHLTLKTNDNKGAEIRRSRKQFN